MWLTGFNAPCLHTMYIDKPMRGHNLMQAITRVNRVFRDKPGGVVVDYIGQRVSFISSTSLWLPEPKDTILLTSTKWFATFCFEFSQAFLALFITNKKLRHSL